MTTPHINNPEEVPGAVQGYGSWGDFSAKSQEDWEAEQNAQWQQAAGGALDNFGIFIKNLPMMLLIQMLRMLADLLGGVPIVGDTMESIVDGLADWLNGTMNTANSASNKADDAQATADTAVGAFQSLEASLIAQNLVVSDHENRITILESGTQVAEFFSNDVWTNPQTPTDPPAPYAKHTFVGISGGGGGRRPVQATTSSREGGRGGGQGGYASTEILDGGSYTETTINVVVGTGGLGATTNGTTGQAGSQTTFADSNGVFLAPGGGPAGNNSPLPAVAGSGTYPEWNASGGRGAQVVSGIPTTGDTGGNGYLASGGPSGGLAPGTPGQTGANCPAGRIGPGGGGGGGGPSARGGHGGFPGGGAGGGGCDMDQFATSAVITETGPGSWTVPDYVSSVTVHCIGGGGAGAGVNVSAGAASGGGGAGGAYARKTIAVTPGAEIAYNVGPGGSSGNGNGSNGGWTWFLAGDSSGCVALGGDGGISSASHGPPGLGTTVGSFGDITYKGGDGDYGNLDFHGGGGGGGAGSSAAGGDANSTNGGAGSPEWGGNGGSYPAGISNSGRPGHQAGGGGAGARAAGFLVGRQGGVGGCRYYRDRIHHA